ncbi:M48 family metalloprotease [Sneathiella sp. HT1-7]|uniref:M48 family metalloprotease n=1 Tax=Sneathiella sp. HT1-7 TaxID=2887192 RepID=UPI001D15BFD4|nr:M48 family metalloprotease [Sneathiella sp. HT1-7]MCC3305975.1 M48 family metalloprotease [Sneathiella sp. HT1-7]
MIKRILTPVSIFLVLLLSLGSAAAKQTAPSFIRDAEIEHTLRAYARPLFKAAGLNGDDVEIYIINSDDLNAFVAGGQRLFIYRGLLERVETPGQLKGVIAHETGHIAGGHLARTRDALANANVKSIVGMILGVAAMVAGGGEAGAAVVLGSQDAATKSFLSYSRTQESSADQAAITYLNRTGQSGRGMVEFLEIIGKDQYQPQTTISSYYRSHPVSSERVSALAQRVDGSPYKNIPASDIDIIALKKMQAKLYGYTRPLAKTLKKYPVNDNSVEARYARAIGFFKYPDLPKAMKEIDSLIAEYPADPYFHELKGQALYENADILGALPSLETAITLAPNEPLILTMYGTVLNATGDLRDSERAIIVLNDSLSLDPNNGNTWDQLATAYSRTGDTGMLSLASAERSLLEGNNQKAIFYAKRAQDFFKLGSPSYLRLDDIITYANQASRKQ